MNNDNKHLIKKLFLIVLIFSSTSLFAWEKGNTLSVTGSGNTVIDHPPGLANDLVSNTYAAFKPGTDGWFKISLEKSALIKGIRICGNIPSNVWGVVGYEQDGMQKMFPSGYFKEKSGEFIIDVSKSDIVTDEIFLIFNGDELENVRINEIEIQSIDADDIYYKKSLTVVEASDNTSFHTSEFQINDGLPGTYWAVRAPEEWGCIHWFVQEILKERFAYNRNHSRWKEGFIELEAANPSEADILRLYIDDEAHGELTIKVQENDIWHSVDTISLDWQEGWLSFDLDSSWGDIQSVRLDVKGHRNELAGIGEVELWGRGKYEGLHHDDLLSPNFSDLKEDAGFFEITDINEMDSYTLTAVFAEGNEASQLSLNGTEIDPSRIIMQDQVTLFEYNLLPNQLWEGDNFFGIHAADDDQFLSAHITKGVSDGKIRGLSGIPGDGRIINGQYGESEGEITLDGEYEVLRLKVYYNGATPGRIYQKTYGSSYQNISHERGMSFFNPGNIQEGWHHGWDWPWTNEPDPEPSDPSESDPVYLSVLEEGDGYILYEGAGFADTIGFTSGSDITEIEIWGSKSEDSTPFIRFIYPEAFHSFDENELCYKTVYGVTDTPDADITINGRRARVSGNIFWIEMNRLRLREYGLQDITASITDDEGRTSSYTSSLIVQSDRYWIEVDQTDDLYYTRDASFNISGRANPWCNNLYINDKHISIRRNSYSSDVELHDGLNFIEIKFTDRWTNRVVGYYIKKVYKYSGEIVLDIKNPVDGIYINEPETYVSGFAKGAGLSSVRVNGVNSRIQGSSFCSLEAIPLTNAENVITIIATDKTGYETSKSITVYRDIIPPEISDVTPLNGTWFNDKDVTFKGIATDDNTCSVFVNGHIAMRSGDSFLVSVMMEEGDNQIDVMATDLAGNVAHYTPFTVKVDTTAPERFDIAVDPEGWTNNRRPEISFNTNDTGIGLYQYQISVNGQNYIIQDSPFTMPFLDDGENTVYVKAYDLLGNVRSEEATLLIDTTAPDAPEDFRIVPGTDKAALRWNETDEETEKYIISDQNGNEYEVSRETGEEISIDGLDYLSFEWISSPIEFGDITEFSIVAIDRAGNFSESISDTIMIGMSEAEYDAEDGAVVEFETVNLIVGKNSLPDEVESVMVSIVESEDLLEQSINPIISPIYRFNVKNTDGTLQDHIEFEEDYYGSIEYNEEDIPEGFPEQNLGIYYFDTMWSKWFIVEDTGVDVENNRVFFKTNHFTNFSVQPTVIEDLSPQELTDVEFSNFSSKISHSPVSISPQGGGATMSMTELVLPGKNGLDFELRRIYDSATARGDASGLNLNVSITLESILLGGPSAALEALKLGGAISVAAQIENTVKKYFQNNGDYAYALGQGWRLNLPYIRSACGAILARTPSGSFHNINSMNLVKEKTYGVYRDLTFENHEGEDFTLKVKQVRADINVASLLIGNGKDDESDETSSGGNDSPGWTKIFNYSNYVPSWVMLDATMYTKDGTVYEFDTLGRLNSIKNKTGDEISFKYHNLVLDYIEDTYGRKIRFEYKEFSEVLGVPQISRIWVEGDDRDIRYSYQSKLSEMSGETLPSAVSLSLPILISANDLGGRDWDYGYESEFLFATKAGAKVNAVGALFAIVGHNAGMVVNSILGISALEIYGGVQTEWVFPIDEVTGPGIGTTKLDVDIQKLDYLITKLGDYFLGLFPTSIQIEIAMQQKFLYEKLERFNEGTKVLTENYDYNFRYGGHKQFYNSRTVVDDGKLLTTYYYDETTKKRNRWIDWSDRLAEGLFTENPISKEIIPLNTEIIYSDINNGFIESKTMAYDSNLRITKERTNKGQSNYTQSIFSYDTWGNRILVDTTELTGSTTYHQIRQNQFQSNEIGGYDNPFASLALNNSYIHDLLRGSVVTTTITGSELADFILPIRIDWYDYNAYGQRTESRKYMSSSDSWQKQQMAYYPVSGNFESGQIQSLTSSLNNETSHKTEFTHTKLSDTYTESRTEKGVLQADGSTRDQSAKTVFELLTGNVKEQSDGRGFITSFSYDNLDRTTELVKPDDNDLTGGDREDNPKTIIDYNDTDLITTVINAIGAEIEYDYDDLGQLVQIKKDNRYPSTEVINTYLEYDGYGNIISMEDPNGYETEYEYDGKHRLTKELYINPKGSNTSKTYSYHDLSNGKQTTYENGAGLLEYFDMRGNVVYTGDLSTSEEVLRASISVYDFDNNVLASMNPGNTKTVYTYDSMGLLIEEKKDSLTAFDGVNEFDASHSLTYEYDLMGNRTLEQETLTSEKSRKVEYSYNGLREMIKDISSYTDYAGSSYESVVKHFYDKSGNEEKTVDGNNNEILKTYSTRNQMTSETDGEGNLTSYEYDKEDRLISMTGPRGNSGNYPGLDFTIDYKYDDLDRLIIGELPKRSGELEKRNIIFDYDAGGNLLSRTEPDKGKTTYTYNYRNWMDSETRSGESESGESRTYKNDYSYDKVGNRIIETYPIGSKTFDFDDMNRLIRETAQDGAMTRYQYDVMDNLLSEQDGNGSYTYYNYDSYNRMIRMLDAKFQESEFHYDLAGNKTAYIDPNTHTWKYEYDEMGRIMRETNSRGLQAFYKYDLGGRLDTLIDPNGTNIDYSYLQNDLLDKVVYTSGDETQTESYIYDEGGVLKSASLDGVMKSYNKESGEYKPDPYGLIASEELSFGGHAYTTAYNYDEMNRLSAIDYSQGLSLSQSWNNLGQLESIENYASAFDYDANGLMTGYNQGNGVNVGYSYDNKNRLSTMDYKSNDINLLHYGYAYDYADNMVLKNEDEYAYDRLNQLIVASISSETMAEEFEVKDINLRNSDWDILGQQSAESVEGTVSFDYDASSLVVDYGYPYRISRVELNGSVLSSLVDADKLQVLTSMFNNEDVFTDQEDARVKIDSATGHITIEFEEAIFARFLKLHCYFHEVDRNRNAVSKASLLTVDGIESVKAYAIKSGRNEFYEYDPKGNRTKRLVMDIGIDSDSFQYHDNSDLLRSHDEMGYRYDKNGNLVEKGTQWVLDGADVDIVSPDEVTYTPSDGYEYFKYDFDLKNRLKAVYKFNSETNLVEKASEYLYDIDGFRIKKLDSSGVETHYVFDTEGKVLEEMDIQSGSTISSVFLKNRHLARVEDSETLYYGTDHLSSTVLMTDGVGNEVWSGDVTPFGDVTKINSDLDIAMKYTGKDYDEDTDLYYYNARWYDAGTGRFISEDPARDGQNWFNYVSNNPLKFVDPTGLRSMIDDELSVNEVTDNYEFIDGRDVKDEASITIQRDSSDGYYNDTMQLRVGDSVITETSVQSEADWPGYEEDTIPSGEYTGFFVVKSGTYDNPILLANQELGVNIGDATLIHPNRVTNESEINRRFSLMEKIGPWPQPFSQNCQITSSVKGHNQLIQEAGRMGFTPRGRFDSLGNLYGNPDQIRVYIHE